jgi:cobalt/nickel transport system permease protein
MHIPDGYLSPATCGVMTAAIAPAWWVAVRRVGRTVKSRFVPLLAIGAAFSFLVMMFNIPVPDGTTAHAVGATIIAILLGPWAAVIAVSIALLIQALFFGDGGVLAFGANAFNMALLMPFAGYWVYRALAGRAPLTSGRRALAAGIAAYVGINVGALAAAIEFGLQPVLFHSADGTPLYAPFHLAQTIPAMALAHLTVAGLCEFAVTAGVVAYLQRANVPVLRINHPDVPATEAELERHRRIGWRWAIVPIVAMIALTPLGLIAPGGAFGEDTPANLDLGKYHLAGVPEGLQTFSSFWSHTLLGGYGFENGDRPVVGYIVSAIVGVLVIGLAILGLVALIRLLQGGRGRSRAGPDDAERVVA